MKSGVPYLSVLNHAKRLTFHCPKPTFQAFGFPISFTFGEVPKRLTTISLRASSPPAS